AARVRDRARLVSRRADLLFPWGVRHNFPNSLPGGGRHQGKRPEEAQLAPQQSLFVSHELASESEIAQLPDDWPQPRFAAARQVEANEWRALDEVAGRRSFSFDRNGSRNHALISKSRAKHGNVVHPIEQGNYAGWRYLNSFQRSFHLISFGCEPKHVNRLGQR